MLHTVEHTGRVRPLGELAIPALPVAVAVEPQPGGLDPLLPEEPAGEVLDDRLTIACGSGGVTAGRDRRNHWEPAVGPAPGYCSGGTKAFAAATRPPSTSRTLALEAHS